MRSGKSVIFAALAIVLIAGAVFFSTRKPSTRLIVEPVDSNRPESAAAPHAPSPVAKAAFSPVPVSTPANEGNREEAAAKVKVLNEVLSSRNDNDPRLDTDFKNLTEADKIALRDRYQSLPAENRNQRGTIVFLLGRNLSASEDFRFLEDVLQEKPCLSPLDCSKPMVDPSGREDEHGGGQVRLVLAYPQIVALKAIEAGLNGSSDSAFRANAERIIAQGEASPIPEVADLARQLRSRLKSS